MNGSHEVPWSIVFRFQGTNNVGIVEETKVMQCPECVALVWSENQGAHDAWHASLRGHEVTV